MTALGSANAAFLSLAGALHAERPGMPALGLAGHVLAGLARVESLHHGLAVPLALYDIRFRDERFWRLEVAACRSVHDGQAPAAADARVVRFARTAVTLAWHFAQSEPRAARLALGNIQGAAVEDVPPDWRFYAGGGGSVRGFPFQSIGPRTASNRPAGGDGLLEASIEVRQRFSGQPACLILPPNDCWGAC